MTWLIRVNRKKLTPGSPLSFHYLFVWYFFVLYFFFWGLPLLAADYENNINPQDMVWMYFLQMKWPPLVCSEYRAWFIHVSDHHWSKIYGMTTGHLNLGPRGKNDWHYTSSFFTKKVAKQSQKDLRFYNFWNYHFIKQQTAFFQVSCYKIY